MLGEVVTLTGDVAVVSQLAVRTRLESAVLRGIGALETRFAASSGAGVGIGAIEWRIALSNAIQVGVQVAGRLGRRRHCGATVTVATQVAAVLLSRAPAKLGRF